MLEIAGSVTCVSGVSASPTLAKCKSGSVSGESNVTAIKTKARCVTAPAISGQTTVQGIMVKGSPVGNPTQLSNIRNSLAKEYVLLDNIDLSGIANWESIGSQAAPFTGILKGNGFVISNLTIDRPTTNYVGLFGYCQFNSSLKLPNLRDIIISNTDVSGQDYVGILAGYVGTTLGSTGSVLAGEPAVGTIINACTTDGVISGRNSVGGIFGMVKGPEFAGHIQQADTSNYIVFDNWIARVNGLSSSAAVSGSGENIGGIIGHNFEIAVYMSNSTGAVQDGDIIGGIIGKGYRCAILSCYTTGAITGIKRVGGIAGLASYRPRIEHCYSEGNITGTGGTYPGLTKTMVAGVGGIAGVTDADTIHDCYALGDISAVYRAGGLVGSYIGGEYNTMNFAESYARGNISVTGGQVGGLIGYVWAGIIELAECYCTGSVTGDSAGAIIGVRGSYIDYGEDYAIVMPDYAEPIGEVCFQTDIFYASDINTASAQYGGTGRTSLDLQKQTTYENASKPWERFDSTWVIDDEEGDLYPQLLCFYEPYGIAISLIRGAQGLTLAYLKQQELFYRQLNGTWGIDTQIPGISQANTLNTFRSRDGRLGFVVDEAGALKYALTEAGNMTIDSIKNLARGTYGDIVSADNEAFLMYVSEVGSLMQLVGSTADGWDTLNFDSAKPIPSDSQIAHLRANIYRNDGYVVWRSRGQHRLMVLSLAKAAQEIHLIRNGSITMSLDSPIVSVSIEFDEAEVV